MCLWALFLFEQIVFHLEGLKKPFFNTVPSNFELLKSILSRIISVKLQFVRLQLLNEAPVKSALARIALLKFAFL